MEHLELLELTKSRSISPKILHSIQNGYCFVTSFSLMRTGPNTCLGFCPARDYLPLLEFGVEAAGPRPSFSAMKRWTHWLVSPCYGTPCLVAKRVANRGYESGAFRLDVTRSRRTACLYVNSQYISLTLRDIDYLSRMFSVVQQQLRDYIAALQDVLPYVTATLTTVPF
jgi:hypothetical protein